MEELSTLNILTIAGVFYILALIIAIKYKITWLLIGTSVLWFIPIFLVDNIFIVVFSVIMIIATITVVAYNYKGDDSFL